MGKPCYSTVSDLMIARTKTQNIILTLKEARKAILMGRTKMPSYWEDCCGGEEQIEIVKKIEILIGELKND